MKINSAVKTVGTVADGGSRPAASQRPASAAQGGSAEQVAISSLSARLQEIEAGLKSTPVFNAERVAEIKQAIAEGRFKVNPERIADGLLQDVRQMLSEQR